MSIKNLIEQLRNDPESIEFDDVIKVIKDNYDYTPTSFRNGGIVNDAGTNEGSCKIFAFAQTNKLSEMETLALFGRFYRDDVLGNPSANDHGNIRNFILDGWLGISFDKEPLTEKR
ncbi:MAG: HopJ type III effector protein [Pseudomonadales bacterium]|nr:HopJ type III effector protein [Pseudomonadales bacterium]